MPGVIYATDEAKAVAAALALEVKIEEAWLAGHPEWAHTELGRRFLLLLNHAKAVLE